MSDKRDWMVGADDSGVGHWRIGGKARRHDIAVCSGCLGGPSPAYLVETNRATRIVNCLWCLSHVR